MKYNMAFIGFGTVGQGLAELLLEKRELLKERYGFEYAVVAVSDPLKGSIYDSEGLDLEELLSLVRETGGIEEYPQGEKGWDSLKTIRESNADVVVEVTYTDIQTGEPAISHIKAALNSKKHVVTTNKGPIALAYRELSDLARQNGVGLRFEGAVMSGTPSLNLGLGALAGAQINEVRGILNGTTNYILTEMAKGIGYDAALREAQRLGYAEAHPEADVEGWDALAKIVILANALLGGDVKVDDVKRRGITGITLADVEAAKKEGKCWKLIARAWREDSGVKARVAPEKISNDDFLAGVSGVTNALTIDTDTLGQVTLIGPGAGGRETGFALLSDLLSIHRALVMVS
jgi:homoserine dehydrogenase